MKTRYLSFLLIFFYALIKVQGQALFFDNFSDGLSKWSPDGDFQENWIVEASDDAGGASPELKLAGTFPENNPNKTARLMSSTIDFTGHKGKSFFLNFTHSLTRYGATTISVLISYNDGATWSSVWSSTETVDKEAISIPIAYPTGNPQRFKFCFEYIGNMMYVDRWSIDDVRLFSPVGIDIDLREVVLEHNTIMLTESTGISLNLVNAGEEAISSIEMWYQVDNKEPISEIKTGLNITPGKQESIAFNSNIERPDAGEHAIKAWITRVNALDVNMQVVGTTLTVKTVSPVSKRVMIEEFTSATCNPCAAANEWLNPFLEEHKDVCVTSKYQMDFPAPGDPYHTPEVTTRSLYYNASGVPYILVDGKGVSANRELVTAAFDAAFSKPGDMDVKGAFEINGTFINLNLYIMPYVSGDYRIHITVNEKKTTGNAVTGGSGNGETEFHHVMMKMLPGPSGTTHSFVAGELVTKNFRQDLAATFVEEYDDLEVAILIQNHQAKSVINAVYAYEVKGSLAPPSDLTAQVQDGSVTLKWNAPSSATGLSGYNIYRDGQRVAEHVSGTTYTDSNVLRGEHVYFVMASYSGNESTTAVTQAIVEAVAIPPENVAVGSDDYQIFTITWDKVATDDVLGYNVYRQGTKVNKELVTTNSYTDHVPYTGIYCYTVKTVTSREESSHSEKGCVPSDLPPTPENVTAEQTESGKAQITIRWNSVAEEVDGYNIYRNNEKINSNPVKGASFIDNVPEFSEYCYIMTSIKGDKESLKSSPACVQLGDVSIDFPEMDKDVRIYPNPVQGALYIDTHLQIERCEIFDLHGRLVYSSSSKKQAIATGDWPTGLYIVRLQTEQGIINKRIIKQ